MSDGWIDRMDPQELLDAVCPESDFEHADRERERCLAARPIGALDQWRHEIRAGLKPSSALVHAACLEITGIEARSSGLPAIAGEYFIRAASVIVEAVAQKSERAA